MLANCLFGDLKCWLHDQWGIQFRMLDGCKEGKGVFQFLLLTNYEEDNSIISNLKLFGNCELILCSENCIRRNL